MYVYAKVSDLEVTETCELSCECWELNPGLLEEQSEFLSAGPSLQPSGLFYPITFEAEIA